MIFFHPSRVSPREEDPSTISVYIITIRANRPRVRKETDHHHHRLRLIIGVPRAIVRADRGTEHFPRIRRRIQPPAPSPRPPPPRSVSRNNGSKRNESPRRTGFSPAVPSRKGLRHPAYTGVPPGCPRGCNEDKSPAYLINSQRSPAPLHVALSPPLSSFPFPSRVRLRTRIVDRIESEFLPRPSQPTRNALSPLLILALSRAVSNFEQSYFFSSVLSRGTIPSFHLRQYFTFVHKLDIER